MNIESILKQHLNEFSQHNGGYPSYKHTDQDFKDTLLEAMKMAVKVFVKEFEDECITSLFMTGREHNKSLKDCQGIWNQTDWHSIIQNQIRLLDESNNH